MTDRSAKAAQYARAAFQALIERWRTTFEEVLNAIGEDQELYSRLMDGSRPFAERQNELATVIPEGAPPEFVNLLNLLLQEEDLDLLPELPGALAAVATDQRQPTRAEVTSAVELTEQEKDALRKKLAEEFGRDLMFSFSVDPSLMGGLRVRVGDRLIDTSVASRLTALRESVSSIIR
ncbi:MAG: ATP synthase F1 subunit delta [Caldilineaceae bacterium]|jgi:F-type H+-transporting ATPase subunit delta